MSLEQTTKQQYNILVVSKDDDTISAVRNALLNPQYVLDVTNSAWVATKRVGTRFYDVVVWNADEKPDNNLKLLGYIKNNSPNTNIIVPAPYNPEFEERALEQKLVYGFIDTPVLPLRLQNSVAKATEMANLYFDGKTGFYTEKQFKSRLEAEIAKLVNADGKTSELIKRRGQPEYLSLLLIDIDRFKQINDAYGHIEGGDLALHEVALAIRNSLRKTDICGRYGGDESAVILPYTDGTTFESASDFAINKAEAIRKTVEGLEIMSAKGIIKATVTIGVATIPSAGIENTYTGLMNAADLALYFLKNNGRRNEVMGHHNLPS
ncbi:diguanylate cyclase [Candidatus Woesearchaeota archaeon]|nr:diguanylate cyclase [Candidatus Woesearchaeota archaeon]